MKSFLKFFKQNYMLYEEILYTDRTLFKHIFSEDAQPTPQDQVKIQQQYANKKANTDENDLESIELIKKYKASPDTNQGIDARNKVVQKYTDLVHAIAWKQERIGNVPANNHNDLFQNGIISMIHGIDKYDPSMGVPFLSYIKNWIKAGIKNPYNMDRKQTIHGDNLTANDSISIDTRISNDKGQYADKATSVADMIADPNQGDNPMSDKDDQTQQEKFKEYLKRLPQKELTAVKMFLVDGKTYRQIGNIMHMSAPATQWFVEKALSRIREFAKEEGYTPAEDLKTSTLKGTAKELFN